MFATGHVYHAPEPEKVKKTAGGGGGESKEKEEEEVKKPTAATAAAAEVVSKKPEVKKEVEAQPVEKKTETVIEEKEKPIEKSSPKEVKKEVPSVPTEPEVEEKEEEEKEVEEEEEEEKKEVVPPEEKEPQEEKKEVAPAEDKKPEEDVSSSLNDLDIKKILNEAGVNEESVSTSDLTLNEEVGDNKISKSSKLETKSKVNNDYLSSDLSLKLDSYSLDLPSIDPITLSLDEIFITQELNFDSMFNDFGSDRNISDNLLKESTKKGANLVKDLDYSDNTLYSESESNEQINKSSTQSSRKSSLVPKEETVKAEVKEREVAVKEVKKEVKKVEESVKKEKEIPIKKEEKQEQEIEITLKKLLRIFVCLKSKTTFQTSYEFSMTKRLLENKSVSRWGEEKFCSMLSLETGPHFIQKMKNMMEDLNNSSDLGEQYKNGLNKGKPEGFNSKLL